MITGTLQQYASVGGLSIQGAVVRQGDAQIGHSSDPELPAAKAGALTTRSDEDTGVITTDEAHGLTDSDVVDVFWEGGVRYGMAITGYTDTTITVDGGAGDDLPLGEDPAVTVAVPVEVDLDFAGDNVRLLAAGSTRRGHVCFMSDVPAVLLAVELPANEVWAWADDQGIDNPLEGEQVDHLLVSNGDSAGTATMKVGVALDVA